MMNLNDALNLKRVPFDQRVIHMEYTERPKRGNGRKAWDKFVAEWHEEPQSVSYTPAYDYQFKGWICEWNCDPIYKQFGYGAGSCHTFYHSSEL